MHPGPPQHVTARPRGIARDAAEECAADDLGRVIGLVYDDLLTLRGQSDRDRTLNSSTVLGDPDSTASPRLAGLLPDLEDTSRFASFSAECGCKHGRQAGGHPHTHVAGERINWRIIAVGFHPILLLHQTVQMVLTSPLAQRSELSLGLQVWRNGSAPSSHSRRTMSLCVRSRCPFGKTKGRRYSVASGGTSALCSSAQSRRGY